MDEIMLGFSLGRLGIIGVVLHLYIKHLESLLIIMHTFGICVVSQNSI